MRFGGEENLLAMELLQRYGGKEQYRADPAGAAYRKIRQQQILLEIASILY
jgi:hypothetical protein